MVNVNDFLKQGDNEAFDAAIAARGRDGIVLIPPRESTDGRDYWLLDRAILLPENTTVILKNCKIKLSDKCRDNFFRSANCGIGIEDIKPLSNIHIRGEGCVLLEGADHPRATGDGGKLLADPCPYTVEDLCRLADWVPEERRLPEKIRGRDRGSHSYGTDVGKDGESQRGDWRNIGILFANVSRFSISGIAIKNSHCWAISLEACCDGYVQRIHFDAYRKREIDGLLQDVKNQDGIDLRNGCHDITISDITGTTGDDVIALTAIAGSTYRPGGALESTHVMHSDWTRRETDIYNVIIRNVRACSYKCHLVRLLPCNTHIRNVVIDGVMDASPADVASGGIFLGDRDGAYGKNLPGGLKNITISNFIYNSDQKAIRLDGYLQDSVITNVVSTRSPYPAVAVARENGIQNVTISNVTTPEGVPAVQQV